jgi:hypothetical protein
VSLGGIVELASGDIGFLKAGLARIDARVEEAIAKFDAAHPERSAPPLAAGLNQLLALLNELERSSLPNQSKFDVRHELEIKHVQFNDALVHALGLSLAASVAPDQPPSSRMMAFGGDAETFRVAIPGQRFAVGVRVVNQSPLTVDVEEVEVSLDGRPATARRDLAARLNRTASELRFEIQLPVDAPLTRPYFTRPHIEQAHYDISDEQQFGRPLPRYPLTVEARFKFEGAPVRISQVVQTVKRVTGWGTVYEPLVIGPAISVNITPRNGVVPVGSGAFPLAAAIRSNVKGPAQGKVRLELPTGWRSDPPNASFSTALDGEEQSVQFMVTPSGLSEQQYTITAIAEYAGREYREGFRVAGYAGLLPSFLYTPSVYRASGADIKLAPELKIGYVMGTGDEVPESLPNLGVHATLLSPSDIATAELSKYDAIVFGVRTYAARPELATHHSRILDYVRNGGVLIVQYNTPEFDRNYGPYPYTMGNNPEEVTDEASAVKILNPAHPLLNWPNRITAKDFDGWVEERGSKWLRTWDPRYEALLETQDEGQEPQRGGLLYARYGKGVYVYAAWAFYRQLPAGVPGAFRLFANILSVPKNPQR